MLPLNLLWDVCKDRPFREEQLLCSATLSCYRFSWVELGGFFAPSLGKQKNSTNEIEDWLAQLLVSWEHPVTDAWGRAWGHGAATPHLRGSYRSFMSRLCGVFCYLKSGTTTIVGSKRVLQLNCCPVGLKLPLIAFFICFASAPSGVEHHFDTWRTCCLFFMLDEMISIIQSAFSQSDFLYSVSTAFNAISASLLFLCKTWAYSTCTDASRSAS